MEVSEAIRNRRSVRRFSRQPVTFKEIGALLESARWAPTASNTQAWQFIVTMDPGEKEALISISPGIFSVPAAIIAICVDQRRVRSATERGGEGELCGLMDACFAAQNILLAAHDVGLGTCVVRSFHREPARRLLGCPEHVKPELLITVGHVEGDPPKGPKRRDLSEIAHLGSWGAPFTIEVREGAGPTGVDETERVTGGEAGPSQTGPIEAALEESVTEEAKPDGVVSRSDSLRRSLVFYLCFLASSARGLFTEPSSYGPLRLVDACSRLIDIMEREGLSSPALDRVKTIIESGKLSVTEDRQRFAELIDEIACIMLNDARE